MTLSAVSGIESARGDPKSIATALSGAGFGVTLGSVTTPPSGALAAWAAGSATGFFLKKENMETFYNRSYSMKPLPARVLSTGPKPRLGPNSSASLSGLPKNAGAGEVRIIGGLWKRSKLTVLDKPGLRPTPDRVRETVFNWLGQDLSGLRCVDAFAGTGALGFEAASRGASDVLLIEQDAQLAERLTAHKTRLKADAIRIQRADAIAALRSLPPQSIDIIFLDPPFSGASGSLFFDAITASARAIAAQGAIYLESPEAWTDEKLTPFGLRIHKQGRAGAVHFHLLKPIQSDPT